MKSICFIFIFLNLCILNAQENCGFSLLGTEKANELDYKKYAGFQDSLEILKELNAEKQKAGELYNDLNKQCTELWQQVKNGSIDKIKLKDEHFNLLRQHNSTYWRISNLTRIENSVLNEQKKLELEQKLLRQGYSRLLKFGLGYNIYSRDLADALQDPDHLFSLSGHYCASDDTLKRTIKMNKDRLEKRTRILNQMLKGEYLVDYQGTEENPPVKMSDLLAVFDECTLEFENYRKNCDDEKNDPVLKKLLQEQQTAYYNVTINYGKILLSNYEKYQNSIIDLQHIYFQIVQLEVISKLKQKSDFEQMQFSRWAYVEEVEEKLKPME